MSVCPVKRMVCLYLNTPRPGDFKKENMRMNTSIITFENSPLITPERIKQDYEEAFGILPSWCHTLDFVLPEGMNQPSSLHFEPSPGAIITLGKSKAVHKSLSLPALAFTFEMTRLPGISMVTNQNGGKNPIYYVRVAIADYPEDLTTLSRILCDAGPEDQVSKGILSNSLEPEHLVLRNARKQERQARAVIFGHLERLAWKYEAEDTSGNFSASAYMSNLHRLLMLSDMGADWTNEVAA